jgi:uncharacterized protein (TIGR03437 family)
VATVLFSNAQQINFVVPAEVAPGFVRVSVDSVATTVEVRTSAPALFSANGSGKGVAAAVALRNGAQIPFFQCTGAVCVPREIDIRNGTVYISLFGTGIRNAADVQVLVDDEPVPVLYSGAQPSYAGLDQVNIRLDSTVRTRGERNVTVVAGGVRSNPLRILLR